MITNISDTLVVVSLIIIVAIVFSANLTILYYNKLYISDIALINSLENINNAIQKVYAKPLTSETIIIYLPQGSIIHIKNNTLFFDSQINITLYDPNNIILKTDKGKITYKIFFNEFIIYNNINKIIIICTNIDRVEFRSAY